MGKLKAIDEYQDLLSKAFPGEKDPINQENWGKGIGAYERTLITPSRFDYYLRGNEQALSSAEQRGLRKFMEFGCSACHTGAGLGGEMFQKFGIVEENWKETGRKSLHSALQIRIERLACKLVQAARCDPDHIACRVKADDPAISECAQIIGGFDPSPLKLTGDRKLVKWRLPVRSLQDPG
jgi:Di-haem cytochrome c peroxidase